MIIVRVGELDGTNFLASPRVGGCWSSWLWTFKAQLLSSRCCDAQVKVLIEDSTLGNWVRNYLVCHIRFCYHTHESLSLLHK